MRGTLVGLLILFSTVCSAQNFNTTERNLSGLSTTPEFLPVGEAFQLAVEIIDARHVRLNWQITPGYYLYKHQFAFALEDAEGTIELTSEMREGLHHNDEYFGDVQIYYNDADVVLTLQRDVQSDPQFSTRRATLSATSQGCADAGLCYPPEKQFFTVDFSNSKVTPASAPQIAEQEGAATSGGVLYMLALAFLGGAILNLMPCVFPILSLKVLSFARSTDHDRHLHSWVYTAGVISSFVLVAALLIALQQAGRAIGWGFQLQTPGFVITLAYLFIVMGLSLSGVIAMGGNLMNTGSGLANRGGLTGSFFTGVLAVVVASPCTAPFMGTALGFAAGQPPPISLLVFAALGAGMAAPLLLFSYSGAARALMPKPGAWMETLKQFLAFPLYATALWLLWVAGRQTGVNTMTAALSGALLLALGLWLWNDRRLRQALALACLVGAVALGSMRGLDGVAALSKGHVVWSEEAVAAQRNAGNPVFVDVTADWCITCLANETAVLLTEDMIKAFVDHGVVYMVADWTKQDANIAALLQQHGRNGIPLYLMYPADIGAAPLILPQLLTKKIVREALQSVSGKNGDFIARF